MNILALYSNFAKFYPLNSSAYRPNFFLCTQSIITMPPTHFQILFPPIKFVILSTTFVTKTNFCYPAAELNGLRNSPSILFLLHGITQVTSVSNSTELPFILHSKIIYWRASYKDDILKHLILFSIPLTRLQVAHLPLPFNNFY